jgi:pimeloyl-ACP methyl ester carboxylesterase
MKIESLTVDSPFGPTAPQPFYRAEGAERLLILLPGRGYTVYHPALTYLAYMGVEQGYDVLGIHYRFQFDGIGHIGDFPQLRDEIDRTLSVIDLSVYRQIAIAGKSMGTPLAVELARKLQAQALILLTPIPQALGDAPTVPTLALIGTADPFYSPQMVDANSQLRWKVYPDLDHGFLKAGDWRASLDALGQIVQDCADFLVAAE